jgi:hypothetical protein
MVKLQQKEAEVLAGTGAEGAAAKAEGEEQMNDRLFPAAYDISHVLPFSSAYAAPSNSVLWLRPLLLLSFLALNLFTSSTIWYV